MELKKIIGYILAGIGLIIILFSSEQGKKFVPFLATIKTSYLIIAGGIFIVAGVVLMIVFDKRHGKQKRKEVPIYKGKEIVGYRRD